MTDEEVARLIYKDYRVHAQKTAVYRSGFLLVGACEGAELREQTRDGAEMSRMGANPRRPNSLAEHSDGLMHLAFSVAMWRPDLISPDELLRVLRVLLFHDAPEIFSGDVPDDGNRDDNLKDQEERSAMFAMVRHWPRGDRNGLYHDYIKFQQRQLKLFQAAYCLDKVEAVLRMLEYERAGIVASIADKPAMSEQDKRFAEEIHSYLAADGWARHVLERTRNCEGRELTYWLMVTAFRDVRGLEPEWLKAWRPNFTHD